MATSNGNYGAADLDTSANADSWYDGLSVDEDDNSTAAAVRVTKRPTCTRGARPLRRKPTMSSMAARIMTSSSCPPMRLADDPIPFTVSSNNALFSLASNETIKLTGDTFGDDTIMNFQDGEYTASADEFK